MVSKSLLQIQLVPLQCGLERALSRKRIHTLFWEHSNVHGGAVQVECILPTARSEKLGSRIAFKFNLCRYTTATSRGRSPGRT
jgi:hypothetical protein